MDPEVKTQRSLQTFMGHFAMISKLEPLCVEDGLKDNNLTISMQEELDQFKRNNVSELAPRLRNKSIIRTKWVFKNKLDENRRITRNKARLVDKGYSQEEGIDFKETYALVTRLDAIRLLITYAFYRDFKLC